MRLDLSLPVILIAVAETVIWMTLFYIFPILLLRWEAEFGWARSEVALAFTLALAASALASPLAGRLIDKGLSRWMFPGAALVGSAFLALLAVVEGQAAFYAVWIGMGVCASACLYEPCFAFLTRVKGEGARGAITTVTLAAGFASTICYPIADALAAAWGWRAAVIGFALAGALLAAPLFAVSATMLEGRRTPRPTREAQAEARAAARAAIRRPVFWLIAGAFPALALTHAMTVSHMLPLLEDRGASAGTAVLAASLVGAFQVLGRILMTAFAARRSAAAIAIFAFTGIAATMALLFVARGEAPIFAAIILFGASYGVLSIVRPLVAADFLGRAGFGGISGALALPYIACAAAAPFVGALLWGIGGYDLALIVGGALAVLGIALLGAARRMTAD